MTDEGAVEAGRSDDAASREPGGGRRDRHEKAWPDWFRSLQEAYAELTRTELKLQRRAAEIQETRDLFVHVIESMSEALFLLDLSGRVVRVNRAGGRLVGAEPGELLGEPLSELCGDAGIPSTPWEIQESRRQGEDPTELDVVVTARDGKEIPTLVSCSEVHADDGSVEAVLVMIRDMTERKAARDRLRESLRQKEVLLREVHHRVKNNLQLVSSLLRLQARTVDDDRVTSALRESRQRISALARIHEHLYHTDDLAVVEFDRYVKTLTSDLTRAFRGAPAVVEVEMEELALGLDAAIPCGLIIHELVFNSLEHAYPGDRTGTVRVRAKRAPDGRVVVEVTDDGVGLDDVDPSESPSLGLRLVRSLVGQFGGEVEFDGENGTRVRIHVPESAVVG